VQNAFTVTYWIQHQSRTFPISWKYWEW